MRNEMKGAVATLAGGLALLGGACNNETQATQTPIGRATSTATVKPAVETSTPAVVTIKVGNVEVDVPAEKRAEVLATITDMGRKTMVEATRTPMPDRTATPRPDATKTAVSTATSVAPKVEATATAVPTATKPAVVVSTPTPKVDVRKPAVEGEPLKYDYVSFDRGQTITVTGPAMVVGEPEPIDSDGKTGQIMLVKPGETVTMGAKNGGAIIYAYKIEQQGKIVNLKAEEALESGCDDGCKTIFVTDKDLNVLETITK